jgi:peptide/nickel transport system substrate-binding protein
MKKRAITVAAAAILSVSALSATMGATGGANAASGAPQRGGTLISSVPALWSGNFIPYLSDSAYDIDIWENQFMPLLSITPKAQVTTVGGVVDKYTISKSKTVFTFWLNPKARWSDGRRVTARDVKFGLEWVTDKGYVENLAGVYAGSWGDIVGSTLPNGDPLPNGTAPSGFKQLGPYEFSIQIVKPYANALISQLSGIVPLPYFAWHNVPFKDWNKASFDHFPTIGDGPWVMSKIIPNEVVVQTSNKYFEYGPPLIPTYETKYVIGKLVPGDLVKGLVNFTGISPRYYKALKSVPSLKIDVETGLGYQYVAWRLNNVKYGSIFQNVHFRRGFAYALNRQAINTAYNFGLGTVETGPLPDVYSWYDPAANSGKYAYAYNPAKAVKEFEEAGLVLNKKTGWFDLANGQQFDPTFTYPAQSETLEQESTSIAQYEHAAHLNLQLNPPLDFNSMLNQLENDSKGTQPIQLFTLGVGLGSDPSFYSSMVPQGTTNPTANGCDITAQTMPGYFQKNIQLLTEQKSAKAFNRAYRKKILDQWQILWSQNLPMLVMNDGDSLTAYAANLHGVVDNVFGSFYDWKWWFSNSN